MKRLLSLFNRLGARERLGVVLALVAVLYLAMDLTLLGPEEKRQRNVKENIARVDGELSALRAEMVIVKAQLERDPFAKDRAQLDAYKKVMEEAEAFLAKVESDPKQISSLLRQIIGSTPGVTLVSLKTLPAVAITGAKGAGSTKQAPRSSIYRRGIEVTVKGNYLALLPYLEKLRVQSTRVLWAEATLDVLVYPDSTLKLLIYALSTQPEASLG